MLKLAFQPSQNTPLNMALESQFGDTMRDVVVGIEFPAGELLLAPSLFDANTSAAAVWLIGSSTATTVLGLSPEWQGEPLATVRFGAPQIYFSGLVLLDPLLVEVGGQAILSGCTLANMSGVRALTVTGGITLVSGTTFEGNTAGAVRVEGGTLEMDATSARANHARRGAALLVTNGTVHIRNSTLQTNQADESGGAVQVDGGKVTLASGTALLDNEAPAGAAISLNGIGLSYELPAPLGRWVFADESSAGWRATLKPGNVDSDYPYVCSPGLMGSSLEPSKQSGPQCEAPCPAGSFCAAGTVHPSPCPIGFYCPLGTFSPIGCPQGHVGRQLGLTSQKECEVCRQGHACSGGDGGETPCVRGTFGARAEMSTCTTCPAGTFQDEEAQTECKPCLAGHFCLVGSTLPQRCEHPLSSPTGSQECTFCDTGYFSHDSKCDICVDGA